MHNVKGNFSSIKLSCLRRAIVQIYLDVLHQLLIHSIPWIEVVPDFGVGMIFLTEFALFKIRI